MVLPTPRRRGRRTRSSQPRTDYSRFEERRLLAGDVSVFQHESILYIRGDHADNQVQVMVDEAGDVQISGSNGTTINGRDEAFVLDTEDGVIEGGLRVNMGRGDDSIFVEGVNVDGRAVVFGGRGDDSVGFYQVDVDTDLLIQTFSGDDAVSVDETNVGDKLIVFTLHNNDVVGIGDTTVGGLTFISTGGGHDDLAIFDSEHNGGAFITTGSGNDFFGSDNLTVNGSTYVLTGFGSDDVYANSPTFNGFTYLNGSFGNDSLEVDGDPTFKRTPRVVGFEGTDVAGGALQTDAVVSDLITRGARLGTINELAALTPQLSTLVGALQATGLDSALDADGPFTVFAPLNSAFDLISDVVGGLSLDQLASVLTFHVASGEIFSDQLVTLDSVDTLNGQSFSVGFDSEGDVVLNGNVTLAAIDIRAKNGVIHLLNQVLVPPIL